MSVKLSKNAQLKMFYNDLHYWQGMVRLDARSLKGSIRKVKDIAGKIRTLKAEPK